VAQAEQIAHAVRQIDPANVEAQTILNASQKVKAAGVAGGPALAGEGLSKKSTPVAHGRLKAELQTAQAGAPKPPPEAEEPAPAVDAESSDETPPEAPAVGRAPATVRDQGLLDYERDLMVIRAQRLKKQVLNTIQVARRNASRDVEASLGELKRALTAVIGTTNIDPDVRESLRASVEGEIDRLQTAKAKIDMERLDIMQRDAAARARGLATEQLVQRDEQLAQLIEKVSSLMAEGYTGNADAFEHAEQVARASFELAPY